MGPVVSSTQIGLTCPEPNIDLNSLIVGNTPQGYDLIWSTDNEPLDCVSPTFDGIVGDLGVYYAYYYDIGNDCYSNPSEGITVDLSCSSNNNLLVNSSMVLNSNATYNRIEIASGVQLTVAPNTEIQILDEIVVASGGRLIVNGGILTQCPMCPKWKGVQLGTDTYTAFPPILGSVGSGSASPSVIVQNGGVIEYAEVGINNSIYAVTSSSAPFSIPSTGGMILLDDAVIRNCKTGVYFSRRGIGTFDQSAMEQSIITNSLFENCGNGIELRWNQGLTVNDCIFNYNTYGIASINSSLVIDNNEFENNTGVGTFAGHPTLMGTDIINNNFFDVTGVEITSRANATQLAIQNNKFYGIQGDQGQFLNTTGVDGQGIAYFDLQANDFFYVGSGSYFEHSGSVNSNTIQSNYFFENRDGNNARNRNNIEYLTNCFENTYMSDIFVQGFLQDKGQIRGQQGTDTDAAGNCFSDKRINTGSPFHVESFDYFTKDGFTNTSSCKYPGTGTFELTEAQIETAESCGSGPNIITTIPPILRDCLIGGNELNQDSMIRDLEDLIDLVLMDNSLTTKEKDWLIHKYMECIDQINNNVIVKSVRDNRPNDAVNTLLVQDNFIYDIMAYGLLLETGSFGQAAALLNSLAPLETYEQDFVSVQNILLDYMADTENYQATQIQLDYVKTVGLERNQLSGFARTVYYLLSNEVIKLPKASHGEIHSNQAPIVNRKDRTSRDVISVYPNPLIDEQISLQWNTGDTDTKGVIIIRNFSGKKVKSVNIKNGENVIDIQGSPKGLLLLSLEVDGKLVQTMKVTNI